MTEENYRYRTDPLFLRNQFTGAGRFQMPVIPKADFTDEELRGLLFLPFDRGREKDKIHADRFIHFFLYDYKFERVWKELPHPLTT